MSASEIGNLINNKPMDLRLTEEHLSVRDAARDFAQNVLLPGVIERDEKQLFPADEVKQLGELGFRLVIYPGAMVRVVSFAAAEYLQELKAKGTTAGMLDRMNQFDQIMDLVGLQESIAEGKAYDPEIRNARD